MILSKQSILRRIEAKSLLIDPIADGALQPCSVDVHLGSKLLVRDDSYPAWLEVTLTPGGEWILEPSRLYLGALREFIRVPTDLCGFFTGCSTEARQGIVPHQQAGLLDPGWYGNATAEITVTLQTTLRPGDRIGQVYFVILDTETDEPYNGRYLGDSDPQPAKPR